jgi:hypothetical protein
MMHVECLEFDQIPKGVLAELDQTYGSVSFENYGDSDVDAVYRASRIMEVIESDVETPVIDPDTFKPKQVIGDRVKTYKYRLRVDEDHADVFAIYEMHGLKSK